MLPLTYLYILIDIDFEYMRR